LRIILFAMSAEFSAINPPVDVPVDNSTR